LRLKLIGAKLRETSMVNVALRRIVILCVALLGSLMSQCAPTPRNLPCSNDGDCTDGARGNAFCVSNHCVECVTSASCGAHRRCHAGECVEG